MNITESYGQCSIDYDKYADTTQTFFKTVKRTFHSAITDQTGAELIVERADD